MISGMGPLALAWSWNQMREPVKSYPARDFGTSIHCRYQAEAVGPLVPGFTMVQEESSRDRLSPCATSPSWKRQSPDGRLLSSPRRAITFWASGGRDLAISSGDWARRTPVKNRTAREARTAGRAKNCESFKG